MRSFYVLMLCLLTFFLSSCSLGPSKGYEPGTYLLRQSGGRLSAEEYLAKAQKTFPPESYHYYLAAARVYLQQHQEERCKALLMKIPAHGLPLALDVRRRLLVANLAAQSEQPVLVLRALSGISVEVLPAEDKLLVYEARATAFAHSGDWVQSVKERILLDPLLLDEGQVQENRQRIWDQLSQLPIDRLEALAHTSLEPTLSGWASLVSAVRRFEENSEQLFASIAKWQADFPEHPAQMFLPKNLELAMSMPIQPKKIALLLPLFGPHATAAKAIQEGVLGAYEEARLPKPSIQLYDTTKAPITDIYAQAVFEGVEFVIGPLTKPEITQLAGQNLSVPVLALNKIEAKKVVPRLFQFALNPEEEGRALAERMRAESLHQVGILMGESPWDKRLHRAFKQRFQQLGGTVVVEQSLGTNADFAELVRNFLAIDPRALQALALAKKQGEKNVSPPRPREDLQAVLLIAQGLEARQLRPMLKFYFAGHLPVYAASHFYAGMNNPKPDRDMNGVIFADMPWLLGNAPEHEALKQKFKTLKSKEVDHYERLYAMGVDAYRLMYQLPRLLALSQVQYRGLTGALSINEDHVLLRQLSFAKMVQGEPVLIQ